MKITDKYVLFWRDKLGNWTNVPNKIKHFSFTPSGHLTFNTSEQLFMYLKAQYFKDTDTCNKILAAGTPKEAKELGRQVKGFSEEAWEKVRESAMFTALNCRRSSDPEFKERLLTPEWRNLEFVEASPYDRIWGIGLGEDDLRAEDKSQWKGLNLLGKCLCELRRYILWEEWVSVTEPHTFMEDLIWCPSQIYYYFEDRSGQKYVVYSRWRWNDPWTIELVEIDDYDNWDLSRATYILEDKNFKDDDYKDLEKEIIKYLKARFPDVNFPDDPVVKDSQGWDGIKTIPSWGL